MNILNDNWITSEPIWDLREREILFLTAEAAGFIVYPNTRLNENIESYPYLCSYRGLVADRKMVIGARKIAAGDIPTEYQEILEKLRKVIRNGHTSNPLET